MQNLREEKIMHLHRSNNTKRIIKLLAIPAICGIGLLSAGSARADTVSWADWTGATNGNPTGLATATIPTTPVTISYTGEVESLQGGYPSWTPASSYVGGTVSNAPPASGGIIQLFGGGTTTDTITFSTPVVNPVMAIWSLGQSGDQAEFDFTGSEPFTVEGGGPSAEYNGQGLTSSGNTVYGIEGNGTIQFNGTFSSLTWTNPVFENWYGFTVGIDGVASTVPLPSSLPMSCVGMASLLAWTGMKAFKRNRAQAHLA
jgi:hypothetical protein